MGFRGLLALCGVTLAAGPAGAEPPTAAPVAADWLHRDGGTSRIIRAPGRLVIAPTLSLAAHEFPFGGIEFGRVQMCALRSVSEPLLVTFEGLGDVGEILEGPIQHVFTCEVRGWNGTVIERLFGGLFTRGESGHAVYSVPGLEYPGSHEWARGVVLLFVPDDIAHVPGIILYHAVPSMQERVAVALQRGKELVMPLNFDVVADGLGRVAMLGMVPDLEL